MAWMWSIKNGKLESHTARNKSRGEPAAKSGQSEQPTSGESASVPESDKK